MTLSLEQKEAEKQMLEYNIGMLVNIRTDSEEHKKSIEKYKKLQEKNLA